jgi:hypothetical protein
MRLRVTANTTAIVLQLWLALVTLLMPVAAVVAADEPTILERWTLNTASGVEQLTGRRTGLGRDGTLLIEDLRWATANDRCEGNRRACAAERAVAALQRLMSLPKYSCRNWARNSA